jgi:hypothetical protein
LRELIVSVLNDPSNRGADPGRLTEVALGELQRQGIAVGKEKLPKSQEYGGILGIKITKSAGCPGLLAATTTIQVPCCGGDTSLYVFRQEAKRWTLVMAVENDGYKQVNGAQDQFAYAVSRSDNGGGWYAIAAYIPGWCTSCYGAIHFEVLRPGPTPTTPRVLLEKDQGVYRCGEPSFKLALTPTGFNIDYVDIDELDFEQSFTTIQTDRYDVSGECVVRVAPVAHTPQDFINAWIQLPWNEARRWSNPARAACLEAWHSRFQSSSNTEYAGPDKVLFVQPCNSPPTEWQVGITTAPIDVQSPNLFFTVSKKNHAFELQGVYVKRPAGCPGEAPPPKTLNWERFEKLEHH